VIHEHLLQRKKACTADEVNVVQHGPLG